MACAGHWVRRSRAFPLDDGPPVALVCLSLSGSPCPAFRDRLSSSDSYRGTDNRLHVRSHGVEHWMVRVGLVVRKESGMLHCVRLPMVEHMYDVR